MQGATARDGTIRHTLWALYRCPPVVGFCFNMRQPSVTSLQAILWIKNRTETLLVQNKLTEMNRTYRNDAKPQSCWRNECMECKKGLLLYYTEEALTSLTAFAHFNCLFVTQVCNTQQCMYVYMQDPQFYELCPTSIWMCRYTSMWPPTWKYASFSHLSCSRLLDSWSHVPVMASRARSHMINAWEEVRASQSEYGFASGDPVGLL